MCGGTGRPGFESSQLVVLFPVGAMFTMVEGVSVGKACVLVGGFWLFGGIFGGTFEGVLEGILLGGMLLRGMLLGGKLLSDMLPEGIGTPEDMLLFAILF